MQVHSKKLFFLIVIFILIITITLISAQDDFELWKKQQSEEFRTYKDTLDKAFVEFLEQQWKDFAIFKGDIRDETPKPEKVPQIEEVGQKEFPDTHKVQEIQIPEKIFQVDEFEIKNSIEDFKPKDGSQIEMTFWGIPLEFSNPKNFKLILDLPLKEKTIADFWYRMSNSDYEPLLAQIQEYKKMMNLNDWGYCLLLNDVGNKVSNNSRNLTKLFIWFMLTKSGYETKIGYSSDKIYLLIPSKQAIYGISYLKFDNKKFYVISFDKKEKLSMSIYTYEGSYPNADDVIKLDVNESPNVLDNILEKELKFKYKGKEYVVLIKYDENTAKFFENYPQTNLAVYFKAPFSPTANYSLISELKPIIEDKSEAEAVNILLRFVQNAFEYQTDQQQFGKEKVLFSDEFLFYPYSDCEDRAIMFSNLVRNLVGLQVIGLDYPGHVATAVKFSEKIKGDAVRYKNERYVICDPTYINADIGMAMPKFKKLVPKVIKI